MSNYMIGKPKLSAGRGQMGERTKKKKKWKGKQLS